MAATLSIFMSCFAAMMRIFLVSAVGALAAKFPRDNPLLTLPAIKYISRLSTFVLVPCLIINALGSALSVALLQKIGILIPFCIFIMIISYGIGYCFKFVHEKNEPLFQASLVAVASPNSISLPIMVMQALCEDPTVNGAYDGDSDVCNEEAYSMMFIYSIGWNLLYWGYFYQILINASSVSEKTTPTVSTSIVSNVILFFTDHKARKSCASKFTTWLKGILSTPSMAAIYTGLFIGLVPPLQRMMFKQLSVLRPLGGAITTLGEPVVAINCLIMASSLAHADINIAELKATTHHMTAKIHTSASRLFGLRWDSSRRREGGNDNYDDLSDAEQVVDVVDESRSTDDRGDMQMSPFHVLSGGRDDSLSGSADTNGPSLVVTRNSTVLQDRIERSSSGRISISGHGDGCGRDRAWSGSDWSPDGEVISAAVDEAWGISPDRSDANYVECNVHVDTSCGLEQTRHDCAAVDITADESWRDSRSKRSVSESLGQMQESEGDAEKEASEEMPRSTLPQLRSILFVILCRLILPPFLIIPLVKMCVYGGLIEREHKLMQLILIVECAAPSAQMLIVSLNHLGHQITASKLAYMFVYMYLISVVTITVWGTVAMSLIY